MPSCLRTVACPVDRPQRWSGVGLTLSSLLLAGAASLAIAPSARSIETITLVFNESQVTVPFSDFAAFVKTGETSRENLQRFLARVPKSSQAVRNVMTREIEITRPFTENRFANVLMDFLLVQLSTIFGSSSASEDLSPLRSAVLASYRNDQRISLLEVMENYPTTEVTVQFPRLERAYNRVSDLVARVRPKVETAQDFLQDLVCDCPAQSSNFDRPDQMAAVDAIASTASGKCP